MPIAPRRRLSRRVAATVLAVAGLVAAAGATPAGEAIVVDVLGEPRVKPAK